MSNTYTLTTIDTTGIQNYIFGSNRLRENVGASALVEQATADWVLTVVTQVVQQHNIKSSYGGTTFYERLDWSRQIETHQLDAEVLYSGGGNTAILFAEKTTAKLFVREYTKHLLAAAPGLEVVCVHQDVVWDAQTGNLRHTLQQTGDVLAAKKAVRPLAIPILGIGATAECESTGLPATDFDPLYTEVIASERRRYRPIAPEVSAKANKWTQDWSRLRLEKLFIAFRDIQCDFWYSPDDTSDLIEDEEGQGRYLAVVHADGNRMGNRFHSLLSSQAVQTDRQAINLLREFSQLIDAAGRSAMAALSDQLAKLISPGHGPDTRDRRFLRVYERVKHGRKQLRWEIELGKKGERHVIPFRPLIYGGDDVTFVCDGRLGLTLATLYLHSFETAMKESLEDKSHHDLYTILKDAHQEQVHACAGVAVVKQHYPFSRAYQLAEELCVSAKTFVRDSAKNIAADFSALDWHFAEGALYGSIDLMRQREYQTKDGSLTMRPIRLRPSESRTEWRDWNKFVHAIEKFQTDVDWRDKRNKVVQLRDALRKGPAAVEAYLHFYGLKELPELSSSKIELQTKGWAEEREQNRCGYFDLIEALDFYLPLEKELGKDE